MKTLGLLAWTFFQLSFLCIGAGISAIPEMQRQVITIHGWLTPREFMDGFALAQVTPGAAMLVSTFIGFRVSGVPGALVATAAIFLPTSLLAWVIARRWHALEGRPWTAAIERALAPLGIGLMAASVYTVVRSAVTDLATAALAAVATLILAGRRLPTWAVVLSAGAIGWLFL